ncbi:hypothetical protein C8R47DRAFT_1297410 [Mycena vitilis]|nr:hypothetical protein C8R47DRAFT_1297410 [Mycena vitilis]
MVNWQSPAEIVKDGAAFGKFMHVLFGLYLWEWVISLRFDWEYVSCKRTFRWPMIFYFLNRYCLLFALIGIAIALNVTTEIDCQSLYTFNQCFGNASIGLASINLSLRTIAAWNQRWFIWVPLVGVILGHWSLLLHGVLLKAVWIPGQGCTITSTNNHLLAISFIYGMVFDFAVLCLTGYKLLYSTGESRLVWLIFNDGLSYFIIAFLSNLLATIFMNLDLNPVMSIIANVPTAVASTVVACRVVRRLLNYDTTGAQRLGGLTTLRLSTVAFTDSTTTTSSFYGVPIQMETFERHSNRSFRRFNTSGRMSRDGVYDPEAQVVGDSQEVHG